MITFATDTTPSLADLDANFADLYAFWNLLTITDRTKPGVGNGGYIGFGAYFDTAWRNSVATKGGVALRFNGDRLQFMAGANSGAAGTAFGAFQEAGGVGTDGKFYWNCVTDWSGASYANFLANASGQRAINAYCAHNSAGGAILARVDYTAAKFLEFTFGASIVGTVTTNGTTTSYNTSSDARLKANVADATVDSGAVLDAVQVRSFDWLADESHCRAGFVAQELVTAVPEAVTAGDAGASLAGEGARQWAVDMSKLVPLLVLEVQRLRARVATLEAA